MHLEARGIRCYGPSRSPSESFCCSRSSARSRARRRPASVAARITHENALGVSIGCVPKRGQATVDRVADVLERALRHHPEVRDLRWWSEDEAARGGA
jgi:hypothetical protein